MTVIDCLPGAKPEPVVGQHRTSGLFQPVVLWLALQVTLFNKVFGLMRHAVAPSVLHRTSIYAYIRPEGRRRSKI